MGVPRLEKHFPYLLSALIFAAGVALITTTQAIPNFPPTLRTVLTLVGTTLTPAGVISFLLEYYFLEKIEKLIKRKYVAEDFVLELELSRDVNKMVNLMKDAENEILLVGANLTSVLYTGRVDLAHMLGKVNIFRVLIADGECAGAREREKQLLNPPSYRELYHTSRSFLREFFQDSRIDGEIRKRLKVRVYEMAPLYFSCIIDRNILILNNYSFGKQGVLSPHFYFLNSNNCPKNKLILQTYVESFEFVWENSKELVF